MQQVVLGIGIGGMRVARVGWEVKRWSFFAPVAATETDIGGTTTRKAKVKYRGSSLRSE
jgi:hypothetical protein